MAPPRDIKRFGVSEVYSSESTPEVDIVFVHGLMGDPAKTWTGKTSDVFWPTELLPKNLERRKENVRVLVYGYNADVWDFGGKTSSDRIHHHAQTMVQSLYANRSLEDAVERPIVFVCHSLGGIVVKRALQHSRNIVDEKIAHLRSIYVSTYGILFLGTPHTGADPAKWGVILQGIANAMIPKSILGSEPHLVKALQSNSETLQNINMEFLNFQKRFSLFFFHETLKMKGSYIVDESSAAPAVDGAEYAGIEANHTEMCKFDSKNSPGYDIVAEAIQRYSSKEVVSKIKGRWQEDKKRRLDAKIFEANEIAGPYGSPMESPHIGSSSSNQLVTSGTSNTSDVPTPIPSHPPSPDPKQDEPPFIVPMDFSRNSIFVGMKTELQELNKLLFDANKRAEGTACVLLWCLAGGGKTHLAREYVYKERHRFPGGVFWVTVKSLEELIDGFWRIAQKAALKGLRDPRGPRGLPPQQEIEAFIEPVRDWLENREEWLLVFDGISVENDLDLGDFRRFIPNHPNSSIIYTSVDRTLARKHLLLNPVPLKVEQLRAFDAQDLLFRELPTLNKDDQADRSNATELVQKMQYLPLMIHTAARYMRTTGLPLRSYLRSYSRSRIELLEPYQRIFETLTLSFPEATNLISIICFFSQHIPVEMLQLGITIMDQPGHQIRLRGNGGRPDLNMTIGILIKYALVDRNDPDDAECSSPNHQDHQHDTLKLHSVVQDFACEFLRDNRRWWLNLAVRVFCHSYSEADSRIRGKSGVGRVSDYHQYKIHGQRLSKHIRRYEKEYGELDSTRFELEKAMESIKLEIQRRTPSSSQDLVCGPDGEPFQISIFDRTSSTSDMSIDSAKRVSTEPRWSFGPDGTHVESPTEITPGVLSLPVKTYESSPRLQQFPLEDKGYDTDRDEPGPSTRTTPTIPQSPRPSTAPDQGGTWHLVTGRKAQTHEQTSGRPTPHRTISALKQRKYDDTRGSWRNTAPTSVVDPRVIKATVEGSMTTRSTIAKIGGLTGGSAAQIALSMAFQKSSPPGSSQGAKPGSQPLSSNHSIASAVSPRPASYAAAVAAGSPPSDKQRGPSNSGAGTAMARDRSGGSAGRGPHHLSLVGSSPPNHLITQSAPPQSAGLPLPPNSPRHPPPSVRSPNLHYANVAHHSDPTLPGLGGYGYAVPFVQPRTMGRNPHPLPYEQITVPTKRPVPQDFQGDGRFDEQTPYHVPPFPSPLPHGYPGQAPGLVPNDVYLNGKLLTGYTSQPMSRHVSQQSADMSQSVADSEPARFPPYFSPPMYPSSLNPPGERDRHVDGAPVRKSPKFALPDLASANISPIATHATDQPFNDNTLSQVGKWAESPPPRPSHLDYSAHNYTTDRPNGPGLGIDMSGHFVQFGDATTINLIAKQAELRRAAEQQRFDDGFYRQYIHPAYYYDNGGRLYSPATPYPPYPYFNLIPAPTMDIEGHSSSWQGGRPRGVSAPDQPLDIGEALEGEGLEMRRLGSRREGGAGLR
ncbi:MAG: hypothetical protein M1839_007295 [Geoglossum umbratile]|nr:MAG: hypothetical protein M1839_007295 [Geoglossum umbratile]